jgi:hypothetical protein
MRIEKMLARRSAIVVLGLVMADAVLMRMLHWGMFALRKDFALGLILGVNLGVLLYSWLLFVMKRNFPNFPH